MKTFFSKTAVAKQVAMILCAFFMSPNAIKAQDPLLDYGPGSLSWCWQQQQQIHAMSAQSMMMQHQIVNYYRNQAAAVQQQMMNNPFQPVQGIYTTDGTYITPQNVNNYHTERTTCEHCDGGFTYKKMYMGNGQVRTVKRRCSYCHGNGR